MKWKNDTKDFSLEGGIYPAICSAIIDIGTQHSEYNGKPKVNRQCIIEWELLEETMIDEQTGDEKRMHFSQFYNQSLDPRSTLRKHLKGWRGRDFTDEELEGFDPKNIIGAPCVLVLTTKDNGKNVIDSISKYKGEKVELEGEKHHFFMTDDDNELILESQELPEWISEGRQKIIKDSDEWKIFVGDMVEEHAGSTTEDSPTHPIVDDDSDIPF